MDTTKGHFTKRNEVRNNIRRMKYLELAFSQSKKIRNDQELMQSDPISCPQNQKGNNKIHKLTAVYERHAR